MTARNSLTHPLQIAEVTAPGMKGGIGADLFKIPVHCRRQVRRRLPPQPIISMSVATTPVVGKRNLISRTCRQGCIPVCSRGRTFLGSLAIRLLSLSKCEQVEMRIFSSLKDGSSMLLTRAGSGDKSCCIIRRGAEQPVAHPGSEQG